MMLEHFFEKNNAAAIAFSLILYALADLQNKRRCGGSYNHIYNNLLHLE